MSFTTMRPEVKTKLDGITELATVYDYHAFNFSGFPAATFEPSGHEADFITVDDNVRTYGFEVIIWQEIEKVGRDEAVRILAAAVDAVVTAFDGDYNLNGTADFCLAVPSVWGEATTGEGATLFATLNLQCRKEITV